MLLERRSELGEHDVDCTCTTSHECDQNVEQRHTIPAARPAWPSRTAKSEPCCEHAGEDDDDDDDDNDDDDNNNKKQRMRPQNANQTLSKALTIKLAS